MNERYTLAICLFLWGCGPSYGGQDVQTSDEWLAEQEKIAAADEKKKQERGEDLSGADEQTDEEKRKQFDKKQTKLELQRATLSAVTCPGVVAAQETKENKQRGDGTVTVTFQEDGTVKSAVISSPFADTPVGICVVNAYKKVIVPPYVGGDQIVDWPIKLEDQKTDKKKETSKEAAKK